jgi:hypothetical protein
VILIIDCYNVVKLCADSICVPTQCIKWRNIERTPRGYHSNVLMKMNVKMGGVNCTLAERGKSAAGSSSQNAPPRADVKPNVASSSAATASETFQSPPKSISWLFDDACMVMVSCDADF